MRRKHVRKAMRNMTPREKTRFARDFSRARARSPWRNVALVVLALLIIFFLLPYFF